ncbi:DUF29 family protein [Argonema antarcticum]|uniref:DUF29 family protein n=1 Tax=Argonema antarcticum TaxID=2942763 RepID=UPI0020110F7D|nr:DUF29 family protein [Argonema antarcticum]MCL1472947.1 DUF29 domain-containing protein [Argonema antarcticum A004/B2]
MTQELIDLRKSILEGRYADALVIVDELEGMSKQAILRNIQSYLKILLIHLIKNQVEQRLTNSWANSIRNSVREIKKLNLQDNKTSYYVKIDEWESMLDDEFEEAISLASEEVRDGYYSHYQLLNLVDKEQIMATGKSLLSLTYDYSAKELSSVVNNYLTQLPGGEDWQAGRR